MELTKEELLNIFGSISLAADELGRSRQSVYQGIDNEMCSEQLTDRVLAFLLRNGRQDEIPDRFMR